MIVTEREREAETQAEGEAGSMHQEPDVGFDLGFPGLRPGPKAGAKPLRHPGIPPHLFLLSCKWLNSSKYYWKYSHTSAQLIQLKPGYCKKSIIS